MSTLFFDNNIIEILENCKDALWLEGARCERIKSIRAKRTPTRLVIHFISYTTRIFSFNTLIKTEAGIQFLSHENKKIGVLLYS